MIDSLLLIVVANFSSLGSSWKPIKVDVNESGYSIHVKHIGRRRKEEVRIINTDDLNSTPESLGIY